MKVAVAQLAPGSEKGENLESTLRLMRQAAEQGARLLVLPELCLSPYSLDEEPLAQWAEEIPGGESVQRWLEEGKRLGLYLVAGLLEREGDLYYNTALVAGPQGLLGRYRKAHLFGWERRRLVAGERPFLGVEIEGARLGVMICYDLRFLEAVRLLALAGVQLLCVPNAWMDVGKPHPWDRHGLCAKAHLALGYAYANRMFVLCANRTGTEGKIRYLGNSLIASPSGEALDGPIEPREPSEPILLIAEVDPQQARDKRVGEENDVFADRRTDLYSLAVADRVAVRDNTNSA